MEEIIKYLEENKKMAMANKLRNYQVEYETLEQQRDDSEDFTFFVITQLKLKISSDKIVSKIATEARNNKLI